MGKCHKASPIIHRKSEKQTVWCDRELSLRHRKVVSPKITALIPSCQKNKNWPNYSTFCTYPAKSNTSATHLSHSYPLPSFINWVQRLILTCGHRRCGQIRNMAATFNQEKKIYSRINIRETRLSASWHLIWADILSDSTQGQRKRSLGLADDYGLRLIVSTHGFL